MIALSTVLFGTTLILLHIIAWLLADVLSVGVDRRGGHHRLILLLPGGVQLQGHGVIQKTRPTGSFIKLIVICEIHHSAFRVKTALRKGKSQLEGLMSLSLLNVGAREKAMRSSACQI